jgi:hypothetical protein
LIAAASAGADRIIMIHPGPPPLYYRDGQTTFNNIVDPIDMAFQLLMWGQYQLEKQALAKLDISVKLVEIMPSEPMSMGIFDFDMHGCNRQNIIQMGKDAARRVIDE